MDDSIRMALGLTELEAEVWDAVGKAAGLYLKLIKDEPGHPMEGQEVCNAFHTIQEKIAMRPFKRQMNRLVWPDDVWPDEEETKKNRQPDFTGFITTEIVKEPPLSEENWTIKRLTRDEILMFNNLVNSVQELKLIEWGFDNTRDIMYFQDFETGGAVIKQTKKK